MCFTISKVKGLPKFDSLEVAKIVNYPFEKRDYKPYAQARAAFNEDTFFIDMWAFEVLPHPKSELAASLLLPSANGGVAELCCTVAAGGEATLEIAKKPEPSASFMAHPFTGEDLQGVFWGTSFEIPLKLLSDAGINELKKGDIIKGNFYKILQGQTPHYGSLYVPEKNELVQGYNCYGNFEIIEY